MAGEEGSLKRCITASVAAEKELVTCQAGHLLKPCATKRKAGDAAATAGEQITLKGCAMKRTAEDAAAGCSYGENGAGIAAAPNFVAEAEKCADVTVALGGGAREEAPAKRMIQLPQEDVDRILSGKFRAPRDFEALRRSNPDLTPPPGEEMDESTELFYDAARFYFDAQERFFKFQDEVRQQYQEKGFFEVDEEYLANREYNRAMILETFEEVCGHRGYRDDDECDIPWLKP